MTEIPTSHSTQPAASEAAPGNLTQEPIEAGSVDPASTDEIVTGETETVEATPEEIATEMKSVIDAIISRKQSFEEMEIDEHIIYEGYDDTKKSLLELNSEFRIALNDYLGQLNAIGAKPEAKFADEASVLLDQLDQAVEYINSQSAVDKAEKYRLAKQTVVNMDRMLENIATHFREEGDEIVVNQDIETGRMFRHYWEMTRDDIEDMTVDYRNETGLDHDDILDEAEDHMKAIDVFLEKVKELEDKVQAEQEAERNKLEKLYKDTELLINKPDGLLYYAIPVASGKKNRIGKSRAREAVGPNAPDGVYKSALKIVENFDSLIAQISSMPNYDPNRIAQYKDLLRIAAEYVYELAKQSDPRGVEGYRNSRVLPQDPNSRTYRRPVTVGVHNAFGKQPLESIDLSELGFMIPKSAKSTASVFRMNGNRANVLYPGYDNTYDESLEGPLPSANFLDLRAKIAKNKYKKNILKFKEQGLNLNTELLRGESFEDWLKRAANTSSAAQAVDIGNRMIAHYLKRNYRAAGFLVPNLSVGDVGKDVSYMRAIIKAAQ